MHAIQFRSRMIMPAGPGPISACSFFSQIASPGQSRGGRRGFQKPRNAIQSRAENQPRPRALSEAWCMS